jgi:two-component system cell cycle response regulator
MRVLIADDDRVFVELTRQRMRALGFDVHVAYDSPTALMAAVRNPPDLILLDIGMPGGTGMHTLSRLKASARTEHVPVVVITASTDATVRSAATDNGAVAVLLKPVETDLLRETVAGVLDVELTDRGTV